jgi:hypothetical protein
MKRVVNYLKLFLWYWLLFGFLFIGCLMYFNYHVGLDYTFKFIISHFFEYLITSMLYFLYPLFFAFMISLSIYYKRKIFFHWIVLWSLSIPYLLIFYRYCGIIVIVTPFIFWYYYFKYKGNKH